MARIEDWQMKERCWNNGYRFYPVPFENNTKVRLELQMRNEYKLGEIEYKQDKKGQEAYSKRMEELYVDIYFMYKHKFIKDKVWCFQKNHYIEV